MDSADEVTSIIIASLGDLAVPGRDDALRASIARAIKHMTIYRILELKERIQAEFDEDAPIVRETLELLAGQIALREIAGTARWR
jgi:hypothetical protein